MKVFQPLGSGSAALGVGALQEREKSAPTPPASGRERGFSLAARNVEAML